MALTKTFLLFSLFFKQYYKSTIINKLCSLICERTYCHSSLFRIQLPDLRYMDCTVDFSIKTFNASVTMCRDLGLRYSMKTTR